MPVIFRPHKQLSNTSLYLPVMKTILLAFLLCIAQYSFGQDITSALIGHAFTDDNTIAMYFDIHTTANVTSVPTSQIEVSLSDISTKTHIPVTNFRLISQVKERVGCDSSTDTYMHQYAASIDLTDPAFSALSSSCVLRGELVVANRLGGSTTTDGHNKTIYVYDEFERCSQKLSNRNTFQTVSNGMSYGCVNQPTSMFAGAFDRAELDSLSFELVNPMIDRQNSVTYKTGFSAQKPLSIANTTDFEFNTGTGDIAFYPSDTSDNKTSVAIKTAEWRKNNSGQYRIVGTNVRELLFFVSQCFSNNPPVIKARFTHEICEGEELCFTISSEDKIKLPPPPLPKPEPDSVTITWNRGIPDASFTVLNPKQLNQAARFCWTPKVGTASKLPYTFVVTARDNFCPINGVTKRAFQVYVTPPTTGNLVVQRHTDSTFSVMVHVTETKDLSLYTYDLELNDVGGNPLSPTLGYFKSTGQNTSKRNMDTIIMRSSTKFVINTKIENKYASDCHAEFQDTFNFHTATVQMLSSNQLRIFPNPTNGLIYIDYSLTQVEVRNGIGQILIESAESESIDLTFVPAGIYTISGVRDNQRYIGKVLKY